MKNDSELFLERCNKNSSISTFKNKDNGSLLLGLNKRILMYKSLTNNSIQFAIDNEWMFITENNVVVVDEKLKFNDKDSHISTKYKSVRNIKKIFKDLSVIEIYRMLEIKKI